MKYAGPTYCSSRNTVQNHFMKTEADVNDFIAMMAEK